MSNGIVFGSPNLLNHTWFGLDSDNAVVVLVHWERSKQLGVSDILQGAPGSAGDLNPMFDLLGIIEQCGRHVRMMPAHETDFIEEAHKRASRGENASSVIRALSAFRGLSPARAIYDALTR
jgi:hypothetical protein